MNTELKLATQPELPQECCAKCFFVLVLQQGFACRREPPKLMFQAVPSQNLAGEMTLRWETASAHPPVQPQRWCGEFKAVAHAAIINH